MTVRVSIGLLVYSCILCFTASCKKQVIIPEGEVMVASVGEAILYQSDLDQIIHPSMSPQDSLSLATAYIDQWIREELITQRAENLYSADDEIEQLTADYKGKLLGFRLEEKILSDRYDTTITNEELTSYYESIKTQFILQEDIYRGLYVRLTKGQDSISDFRNLWKSQELEDIHTFAVRYADIYLSDTTTWKSWTELSLLYPRWSLDRANRLGAQIQQDDEYEYFLKIVDREAKGEVSPFKHVAEQLKKMLLHQRKGEIMETYKQELYESALNNNQINIR